MTFAPPTILAVRRLLKGEDSDLDDNELGIVGGPSHVVEGTSYHLGLDQLKMSKNPYSARHPRDRAGLSNAASALDVDDDLDELRPMSVWIVGQCQQGASDCADFAEIIFSPDGVSVFRWDADSNLVRSSNQLSHREHTHFAWRRDSEFRDKTAVFKRFFEEGQDMALTDFEHTVLMDMAYRQDADANGQEKIQGGQFQGRPHIPTVWRHEMTRKVDDLAAKVDAISITLSQADRQAIADLIVHELGLKLVQAKDQA